MCPKRNVNRHLCSFPTVNFASTGVEKSVSPEVFIETSEKRKFKSIPVFLPVNIDTATFNHSLNFDSIPLYMLQENNNEVYRYMFSLNVFYSFLSYLKLPPVNLTIRKGELELIGTAQ